MSNRILLIGFYYPPHQGVGAIRISKFAKYLAQDWDVHVMTAPRSATNEQTDLNHERDVTIHRVSFPFSFISKTLDHSRWSIPLAWKIRKLCNKYDFDCVWHTGNPFFPLYVTSILSDSISGSYIVDFRDSWTLHPYSELSGPFGKLNSILSTVLEPKVLDRADAVTTATEGITNAYRNVYPEYAHKFHTIENGYDPDDFPHTSISKEDPRFTLVYVGKFGNFRDPNPLFKSISRIKSDLELRFVHIGKKESRIITLAKNNSLYNIYECTGYMERKKLTEYIRQADVGIAISGGSNQEMTTKIFDYMACETPILACGPTDGAMASVVQQFENGYIVPNDQELITEKLMSIINKKPKSLGPGPYDKYTRRHKAKELETIIVDTI